VHVTVEHLTYQYPGSTSPVLNDVSFDVPAGVSAAIIGPSGSGKTTLVSLLGGLLRPQTGEVACVKPDGSRIALKDAAAWILQTVSLLPERTVADNARLGAYLDGADGREAQRRAMTALGQVGLASRAAERAGRLSGGEAQRVAIARALASHRPVILADEPTGNLDRSTSRTVLDALFSGGRRTVLLVTHDDEAAARCDLVLRLADGQLRDRTSQRYSA
jgi:putative ABC transport system ATP-binding protein/lipoprotein-releasing system ATP-binding protein